MVQDYLRRSWAGIIAGEMASPTFFLMRASPSISAISAWAEATEGLAGHEYPDFGGVGNQEPGEWRCCILGQDHWYAANWVVMDRFDRRVPSAQGSMVLNS